MHVQADYCPRRPDFEEVACGLLCAARGCGGAGGVFRSGATPCAGFGFREKSGMCRSPFRFMRISRESVLRRRMAAQRSRLSCKGIQ